MSFRVGQGSEYSRLLSGGGSSTGKCPLYLRHSYNARDEPHILRHVADDKAILFSDSNNPVIAAEKLQPHLSDEIATHFFSFYLKSKFRFSRIQTKGFSSEWPSQTYVHTE